MDFKENLNLSIPPNEPRIKPEPQETHITPLIENKARRSTLGESKVATKLEIGDAARIYLDRGLPVPNYLNGASGSSTIASRIKDEDVDMKDAPHALSNPIQPTVPEPLVKPFTVYQSEDDITYVPEDALKQGLGMVKSMKHNIKRLELGSKLRKDVWLREIESLQGQGAPTTMIAICGATGAGKSSILNAILDDNIVPTSGMRACTAVVTEIGYHPKKTIDADVSFLSEAEWRQELAVLLDDLVDEDGKLKRSTDLRSDAGVAWQKVHAVYPAVSQEQIIKLTVDQILSRDPRVAQILGTTKHITAKDSKAFAQEIGKYIDSKDQKRGDKKEKNAKEKKDKDKGKSIIEKLREQNNKRMGTGNGSQDKSHDLEEPAFWPLIRQVQVQCNAGALSTGAILVDLPGVADANAARNNIAKDYMKKCDCIWILAPITRAVDDKTARDLMGDAFKMQLMNGNYDDHAITFIATKCDDVSCSEVIRALNLDDDPALVEIEDEIDACNTEMDEHKGKKKEAESTAKEIDQGLKQLREFLAEYQDHLKAMENGETFVPKLTAKTKAGKNAEDSGSRGKKRKNSRGGKKGSPKRRKNEKSSDVEDEDDDFLVDDDDDLDFSGSESDKNSGDESDGDKSESGSNKDSGDEEDDEEDQEAEEATEESLKEKIEEAKNGIKEFRVHLSEARKLRKEAMDALAGLKKRQNKAQREKNAFCSLKRSEFSRDVLKEDFRIGLKDLDDAAAEQRDPDSFDPTLNIRNYEEIDLPVFTCSSRDYVRLKGQVKGDGDPACFTKFEDTGIPELQKWCHQLTVSSRERAARNFMTHLKTFATSVKGYVQGIGDVTVADRDALREKWESILPDDDDDDEADPFGGFGGGWASSDDPFDLPGLAELANPLGNALYTMQNKAPKVDRFGELVGITPRLVKDFMKVIDDCVHELQKSFRDGLEEKCRVGAINAAAAALETSDNFAASMHWGTYRATLRRHGSWRQDLNVELSNPFTRQIASSWSKVFEADLFSGFEKATKEAIKKVLKEVEESAALGLKERAKGQAEQALEEARVALEKTLGLVRDTINTEQKEVSRCLAPHIRNQLVDDYNAAMAERGKGSVARQKALFHDAISDTKSEMFDGAADVIMGRLAKAAEAVGKALEGSLSELAETVEVSVAVLWEGVKDDPAQVKVRTEVISSVAEIIEQIRLWQEAARQKQTTSA